MNLPDFMALIIIIMAVGMGFMASSFGSTIITIKYELGQSICDQEYNMDYESYDDGELTCKPKEIAKQKKYDGIVVNIKKGLR